MEQTRWQRLRAIFAAAAALGEEERAAFLDRECGEDSTLKREVLALIRADAQASQLLDPGPAIAEALDFDQHLEGATLGAYRLLRRIGAGGMGSVFLAERADGTFERQVALKVVKKGMDTESVVRRFEMERQILARLDHPGVARILDGGITGDGRPYFVMDYVDGLPITEYCDRHRLDLRARLSLFREICDAVHYAHQRLIVHRDLKPSNILVTSEGGVKLLDFGIAKLLDSPAGDELTQTGLHVLTPAYASPEQVLGLPITTTTDVYALGLILYELLCGRRPFEERRTAAERREQMLDTIPPRPSSAITRAVSDSQSETSPAALAAARAAPLLRLQQVLRGDLDTICLKAIRREAAERYSSAEQLSADVARYLAGRPVIARPDTVAYRVGKFIKRNRAGVAVATTVAVAFIVLNAFYTGRLQTERDVALEEQQKVSEVVSFVTGLFEVSDPYESRGEEVTARELLDAGAERIRTDLANRPELQATMMRVLGQVYYSLGAEQPAEALLEQALARELERYGETNLETARSLVTLGFIHQDRGDYKTAEDYYARALATRRTLLGDEHAEVMEAISAEAFNYETMGEFERAEVLHKAALAMGRRLYPGDSVEVAEAMSKLAGLYRTMDRADEAEPLLRDSVAMLDRLYGGEHPRATIVTRMLAGLLRNTGRYEESKALYLKAIDGQQRILGPDHPELAVSLNGYSQLLSAMGDTDAAIETQEKMIAIVAARGQPHPSLAAAYSNLAFLDIEKQRYDDALENFQKSLTMQDAIGLPPRHPNRSFPTTGIADVYRNQGRYAEAEAIYRDMLALRREAFGEEHRLTSEIKSSLGATLTGLRRYGEAEALLLDAYQRFLDDRGPDDSRTTLAAKRLAVLYEAAGEPEKAVSYRALSNAG